LPIAPLRVRRIRHESQNCTVLMMWPVSFTGFAKLRPSVQVCCVSASPIPRCTRLAAMLPQRRTTVNCGRCAVESRLAWATRRRYVLGWTVGGRSLALPVGPSRPKHDIAIHRPRSMTLTFTDRAPGTVPRNFMARLLCSQSQTSTRWTPRPHN
jgi:hypothetical protein